MRHFTGLTCPDRVASLNRIQVLGSGVDRIAGCVYQGDDGTNAILRSHPAGTSADITRTFAKRYSEAGFSRLETTGASAAGVSFRTGHRGDGTRCETLWRFAATNADYTLWMVYTLPSQAESIGPMVTAFASVMAKGNRR
ncbi:hypothetical protein [Stappia stellulata]|uniref:hypothetical protein n=1 Tax=Stappia stellulata TaxID=71235 RepID=UPI000407E9A3|nr:hypothetical protein [Stappia stellulata]